MARSRVRAATRKARQGMAHIIGSGVYTIALELEGRQLPLPLPISAPVIYAAEMVAAELTRQHDWVQGRLDDVSKYVYHSLQEVLTATIEGFDREHFEAYIAAAALQEEREGVNGR